MSTLTEERANELLNNAMTGVFAIADGHPELVPGLPEGLTNSEMWAMVGGVLELIKALFTDDIPDRFTAVHVLAPVERGELLGAQIVACWNNDAATTGMHLFFAASDDDQAQAAGDIWRIAAALVNHRRAGGGSTP